MRNMIANTVIFSLVIVGVLLVFLLGYENGFPFYMSMFFVAAVINLLQFKQIVKKQENGISSSQRITLYRSIAIVFICSITLVSYIVHYLLG